MADVDFTGRPNSTRPSSLVHRAFTTPSNAGASENPGISRSEIDMRRGLGVLGLLVTIVIVAVVGVIAYQAGWSDGFAQHLPEAGATAAPAGYPYYYGGPHFFGFGWIFGLLFFLFFIWLLFRIAGFAMWG